MASLACSREFPASKILVDYNDLTVALRPMRLADAQNVMDAVNSSHDDLKRFMPFAHVPQTIEDQVRRIRRNISPSLDAKEMFMGLFDDKSQKLLQVCGLHQRCPLNPDGLEIGYWTPTSEANKGYATLATRLLIIYCTEAFEIDRIQISHNVYNERSKRVIDKCGFVFEGKIRNATGRPAAAMVANGYEASRDIMSYSLLPHEARSQSWYASLANRIQVFNQLEENLGFLWKNS